MRVGVDVSAAINQHAGIGRYARGVLGAIAAQAPQDWYLQVGPRPNPDHYTGPLPCFARGRRVALPVSERNLWIAWQRLRLPLPPDLLAPRLDVFYNPDFMLPRLAYAPGVCTVHDLGFITVPDCAFPKLRDLLLRAVPWALGRARRVIAVSEHTRHDLVTILGVPPDIIRVAGNAPDPLFRQVVDPEWLAAARARLHLPDRFLLAVGTLEPRKNLTLTLEALARLKARSRILELVVVGREGWLFEPIYETVDRLGLSAQVHFLGGQPDLDLLALYNLCDALVYPSLYEGFGIPPLEALACGAVVVCSNASSLPATVGDAALLVDPYDAAALATTVERALDDAALRDDLSRRGPGQAARFRWEDAAAQVLATLREAAT